MFLTVHRGHQRVHADRITHLCPSNSLSVSIAQGHWTNKGHKNKKATTFSSGGPTITKPCLLLLERANAINTSVCIFTCQNPSRSVNTWFFFSCCFNRLRLARFAICKKGKRQKQRNKQWGMSDTTTNTKEEKGKNRQIFYYKDCNF